ncbi:MAG: hypothetical protein GY757_48685 [bacterium]|nr:hypothetical protein [bacterium]
MSYDDFAKNFKDHSIPDMLTDLFDFASKKETFFAGSFELFRDEQGLDDLNAWFDDDDHSKDGTQLLPFGHDGLHSLYCFWLYPGKSIKDAPIVYLSSEFEGSSVIANGTDEFLTLLASNKDYSGYVDELGNHFIESEEDCEEENQEFGIWLNEKHGLLAAKSPDSIMMESKKKHPNFHQWLDRIMTKKNKRASGGPPILFN